MGVPLKKCSILLMPKNCNSEQTEVIKLAGKGFSGLDDFTIKVDKELPAQSNEVRTTNTVYQRPVDIRIKRDTPPQRPQHNHTNTRSKAQTVPQSKSSFSSKAVKVIIILFVINFALNWLFENNIQSTINDGLINKYRASLAERSDAFRGNLLLWNQTSGSIDRNQSSIESSLAINRYLNNYSCIAVIRYGNSQVTQYKGRNGKVIPGYQKVANITIMDRKGNIIGHATIRGAMPPETVRLRAGSSAYYGDMGNSISNWANSYPNLMRYN